MSFLEEPEEDFDEEDLEGVRWMLLDIRNARLAVLGANAEGTVLVFPAEQHLQGNRWVTPVYTKAGWGTMPAAAPIRRLADLAEATRLVRAVGANERLILAKRELLDWRPVERRRNRQ